MIAADVYGSDGRVVLMERGTRLIGEVHGDVHAGQSRVAVAWTDARTPAGVRLALLSMATDSVGRAGVPGLVDRHFGERFGAAVLLSFVDGAATALTARQQGQASVVYNAQPSRDIATEALRSSIGIPPTIRVAQGTRIQVIVASDVNFRSVYRLAAREQR
jgi:type IV secretion system protein VirB10